MEEEDPCPPESAAGARWAKPGALLGWAHIAALWLKKLDAHGNRHAVSQPRRATMMLNQN